MKKSPFYILKVGVACSMLLGGVTLGSTVSAEASSPVTAVPISAKINKPITVKEETLTSDLAELKTDIQVPQITGMLDAKYQDQLNDIILSHANKDLEYWEKEAAEAAKLAKEEGYDFRPYELFIKYELKSDGADNGIISLVITTESATGATSMPRVDTYNVRNAKEAGLVTMKDFLGDDYKAIADEQISKKIAEQPDLYFEDVFMGISEEQSFYVENGEVVVLFQKYEIAPGAAGTPEFRITKAETVVDTEAGHKPTSDMIQIRIDDKDASQTGYMDPHHQHIMLPLRETAEALGFQVKWNAETQSAELSKPESPIWTLVQTGKDQYSINKMYRSLGAEPVLKEHKLHVPASFFREVLRAGVTVKDDQVIITSEKEDIKKVTRQGVITAIRSNDKSSSIQIDGIGTEGTILNIDEQTIIRNAEGEVVQLDELSIGLSIEVVHSLAMTMSLPGQTYAFEIKVLDPIENQERIGTSGVIEDILTDQSNNQLKIRVKGTGITEDSPEEVVLMLSPDTVIVNQEGKEMKASELEKDAQVLAFYSPVLTRSLPPIGKASKVVYLGK